MPGGAGGGVAVLHAAHWPVHGLQGGGGGASFTPGLVSNRLSKFDT